MVEHYRSFVQRLLIGSNIRTGEKKDKEKRETEKRHKDEIKSDIFLIPTEYQRLYTVYIKDNSIQLIL